MQHTHSLTIFVTMATYFFQSLQPDFNILVVLSLEDIKQDHELSRPVSSTADRLAQLVEHRTTVREVSGSKLGRTNTQGL